MNILLAGYYGKHNIGDDLFVHQLIQNLSKRDIVKKVFVFCDRNYYKPHPKVTFIPSDRRSKLSRLMALLQSDCVAWGGGTLELDEKPTQLVNMQKVLRLRRKPFCFLGIGLESVAAKQDRDIEQVFRAAEFLYCRDQPSYDFARHDLLSPNQCHLGGDLAFLDLGLYSPWIQQSRASSGINHLSFSGMFWWGNGRASFYASQLIPLIETFQTTIHLLPAHMGGNNDNQFHQQLLALLPPDRCVLHEWQSPEDFLNILSQMDFHMGNRLHSIITADILGIPNIGIAKPGSKIDRYIQKTQVLTGDRRVDFMQSIPLHQISQVYEHYTRPSEFITQESGSANAGIETVIGLVQRGYGAPPPLTA